MKIIFYKAKRGRLLDKLIAFWTLGEYSHVELVLSDNYCYSASSRDNGVRRKVIADYETSGKWDIFNININEADVKEFYSQTKELKYDWVGILLSEFVNFNKENKNTWYCSEWVANIINISNKEVLMKTNISPNRLYGYLIYKDLIK